MLKLPESALGPLIPRVHLHHGDIDVAPEGPFDTNGRRTGVDFPARWTILDKLLVDAAAEAGAEVREGFAVEGLVIEDGQVVGIERRSQVDDTITDETQQDHTISAQFVKMRNELDAIFDKELTTGFDNVSLTKPGPYLRHSVAHGLSPCSAVLMPAREPLSRSLRCTHSRSVSAVQPMSTSLSQIPAPLSKWVTVRLQAFACSGLDLWP